MTQAASGYRQKESNCSVVLEVGEELRISSNTFPVRNLIMWSQEALQRIVLGTKLFQEAKKADTPVKFLSWSLLSVSRKNCGQLLPSTSCSAHSVIFHTHVAEMILLSHLDPITHRYQSAHCAGTSLLCAVTCLKLISTLSNSWDAHSKVLPIFLSRQRAGLLTDTEQPADSKAGHDL